MKILKPRQEHKNSFSLHGKLIFSHLCVGILPLLLLSGILWIITSSSLEQVEQQGLSAVEQVAYEDLQKICAIKEKQIAYFFQTLEGQMRMFRDNPWLLEIFTAFDTAFTEAEGAIYSAEWQRLAGKKDLLLRDICTDFDWHNLFLINAEGSIIYTLNKAADLGHSLHKAPLQQSSLGRAFADLQLNPGLDLAFGDYAPYAPLHNEPSAFLITHLRDSQQKNKNIGYLAVQPSTDALRNMIRMAVGKNYSLEAYLVGMDGFMRSDTLLDPENYSRAASFRLGNKVDTVASREALNGKSGTGIIKDYRGDTVLSSWNPVEVLGVRWALICEIDEAEALRFKTQMSESSDQASKQMLEFILLALLLTFLAVGGVAWWVARSISKPITHAATVADLIAAGDLEQRLRLRRTDEIGQLADALDSMVDTVARNFRHKSGIAELADQMRGQLDVANLASNIINFLAKFLGAQMGSLYLTDASGKNLYIIGSYAFHKRKALNTRIGLGEGIAGQAALENNLLSITQLPEDYVRITSTLGDGKPCNVVALPFSYEDKLIGVLELASFKEFSDQELHFLRDVAESIAIVFDSAQRRQEMQELLTATQQQSEELMQQSEELKATNEELETQAAALKEFQEELETQQAELEVTNARLKEKTEELQSQKDEIERRNWDLMAAREELEERSKDLVLASKYKSEFLANMSHELRTPLNSLLLLSRALADNKEGNLTQHQQESAEIIVDAGKDLLNLINEILDLSKIEAGRVELELEEVLLEDIADNVENMFHYMAEKKGLALHIEVEPSLPLSLLTDRKRLEQILKNFLGNALKFTEQGEVKITFARPQPGTRFRREDLSASTSLAIKVADTGIGIALEKQKIIFEAFQQADGSTGRKYGGTGLGLSISRELANLLGGEIQLNSTPGVGSVFTLYLPCHYTGDSSKPKEEMKLQAHVAVPTKKPHRSVQQQKVITDDRDHLGANERSILIIEDDRTFAKILKEQCQGRGFKALAAESGEEGLQLADRYQPTGIILDLKLPGIDGWTVLTSLKTNPRTRHIPVHIMSAEEVSREAFKQGAVGFFTKPVDQEHITEALARFETISSGTVKKLLVVEDDAVLRGAITELVASGDTVTVEAKDGQEAYALLQQEHFDCMVLDLGLPDCNGIELLRRLATSGLSIPPVIVYTGRDLSREEEKELNRYAESIIIKNARSKERLLDETSLFLHRMIEELPDKQQEIMPHLYDHEHIFKGKKILLVDDDMRNVFALSAVLEERKMEVIIAEDGKKALDILAQGTTVDLVLMDIMMPEMDGYEASRRIRQQSAFKKLPIIALTAKAMKEDREKCIAAGANDYLTKPVDLERLLSMMRVWLYT